MRILIDVDGVLADLAGAVCAELAAQGRQVRPEQFTTYDMGTVVSRTDLDFMFSREGFCASLDWYPGARAFLACLQDVGDVVAVTKPFHGGKTWAHERTEWLQPYLPAVISTAHKKYVAGDVLVEDSEANCYTWLEANTSGRAVLIDRPWNRAAEFHPRLRRAKGWAEALRAVRFP